MCATHECHATDTGHVTPPRHSIQTRGRPIVVLFIDVKRHTGIHNYQFPCLGSDTTGKLYDDVMVVVSRKLAKKYRTNRVLNPRTVECESITLSARPQLFPTSIRTVISSDVLFAVQCFFLQFPFLRYS